MADPFSLATGLVGLVGVAIQVTQVVVVFIAQWKDVPKDTNNFMLKLLALKTHLSEIYTNLLLNPVFANVLHDQTRPCSPNWDLKPYLHQMPSSFLELIHRR
jgi:hypothetical protein